MSVSEVSRSNKKSIALAENQGRHHEFIKDNLPGWVLQATPQRRTALRNVGLTLPAGYATAQKVHLEALNSSSQQGFSSQNDVDQLLADLKDAKAFARPLVTSAILERFKVSIDVDKVLLRYSVPGTETFADATQISISLLDAALHNFTEADEVDTYAAHRISGGRVLLLSSQGKLPFSVEDFAKLCRQLDVGGQYQAHVNSILGIGKAEDVLRAKVVLSQRQAFFAAIDLARMQGDIDRVTKDSSVYNMLLGVNDKSDNQRLDGKPVQYKGLKLFGDTELVGIVLIGPDRNDSETVQRLVAYIPHDPVSPIKEYPSARQFHFELRERLRDPAYQDFFSRFVRQEDKASFFSRLNDRLTPLRQPPNSEFNARERIPDPDARIPVEETPVRGDLWQFLFDQQLNKLLDDARFVAVSTADVDAQARHEKLLGYLGVALSVLNVVALFVPPLGVAMMTVMAVQLTDELVEGIESLAQGEKDEGFAYLMDVAQNLAQLAVGAAVGAENAEPVTPIRRSAFFDSLKQVTLPNGQTRLWKPDLNRYELSKALPNGLKPDELGLLRHDGQAYLSLEDKLFKVSKDPQSDNFRIEHPDRVDAYKPLLEHNGAGSWKTELDQPLEWDKRKILRRLGASVDGLSDETLEQILTTSGVHENVLRRLHVEHETPPALLADTLTRFKAHADALAGPEQILANRIGEEWADYAVRSMTEMRGWPSDKAIEVFEGPGLTGKAIKEGYAEAAVANTLQMTWSDLLTGALPERVVEFLDEPALREMLQEWQPGNALRSQALREQWAALMRERKRQLFDLLYRRRTRSDDPLVNLLKGDFAEISTSQAQELLAEARPSDMQHLTQKKRVPLRLTQQALVASDQLRITRAYEGLYLDALHSDDTARLELHSLAALPGWPTDLRLEVREDSFQGPLFDSLGPVDAPIRKVLVLDNDGKYEARDASDQQLHGADNLYAAVLHALPDSQRTTLGFDIHEATRLQGQVRAQPLARQKLESILEANRYRKPAYDPAVMRLRGGMPGYAQLSPQRELLQIRMSSLYPGLSNEQVEMLLEQFEQNGGSALQRVTALETEFNRFNATMQRWMNSPTESFRFGPAGVAEWRSRDQLYTALRQCWRRTGPQGGEVSGIFAPQALILDGMPLDRHLATLPPLEANFDHVTGLSLRNTGIGPGDEHFLQAFRQVRELNLQGNRLTRLSQTITDMRHLAYLILDDNMIELDALAVARLRRMTQLKWLLLQNNPLRLAPDISQMPHLHVIRLNGTGLNSWPVGLFSKPRPRSIFLDLRNNPINQIPHVAPGSFRAELLARTHISREPAWLSAQNLEILKRYIESVGMDPERPYPPLGTVDSSEWAEGISEEQWRANQHIWNAVEDEFYSESFFSEINRLTQSADFKAGGEYRKELTAKVWRMLEAMSEDSELRTKLFNEAATPTQCVDGGTQLFNAMGVEVLVKEAYDLIRPDLIEPRLLELAWGKSRLDELGAIARKRVAERLKAGERFRRVDAQGEVTGTIDEVEVHLAYMTELAERLDLPWQARGMQFRNIAGVTKEMIEAAFQRITVLEEGDLLRDRILDQPLWIIWLESENKEVLSGFRHRIDVVTELYDALQRRAEETGISVAQKAELEAEIKALAVEAGRSENEFANGRGMTEEEYTQALNDIDVQMKAQMSTLTQQAMDRAGLQRVDIPFTIDPNYSG